MKLFVGIPCYQNMPVQFAACLFAMEKPCEWELRIVANNPYISLGRAMLAAEFLESDCSHLLFIDSDILFTTEQVKRLLSHGVSIVGGFLPKKQAKLEWVCNALPEKPEAEATGLIRVAYMSTGFMLITRLVFENMIQAYGKEIGFKHDDTGKQMWDFFSVGVHKPSNRWLAEDWWFCQRALDLGYTIYGDTKCVLKHIGTAVYPLDKV